MKRIKKDKQKKLEIKKTTVKVLDDQQLPNVRGGNCCAPGNTRTCLSCE